MDRFEKMLKEIRGNGLPNVIYGAGQLSDRIRDYLLANEITLTGYLVDMAYMPKQCCKDGLPIFATEDYLSKNCCNVIVGVMYFSEEKEAELKQYQTCPNVYTADFSGRFPLGIAQDCKFTEEFLSENSQVIEKLRRDLADEASVKELERFIEQRCSGEFRKHYSTEPQYFESGIVQLHQEEVFVDCGAYDGDTVMQFASLTNGKYKKIYAFEADLHNIENMKQKTNRLRDLHIIPMGVFNRRTTAFFESDGRMTSRVTDHGIKVEMTSIDETVGDDNVTFIKMDIEGSELQALHGAEKTILRCKPKLAICVYHRLEDIITIPQYIQSLIPEYRLYFRNYHSQSIEAVIYAL